MKTTTSYIKLVACCLVIFFCSAGLYVRAQEAETTATVVSLPSRDSMLTSDSLTFNFRGASLDTVLDYMSRAAGFIIVRKTEVSGRVDVVSHQPVTKDEAVELLGNILSDNGYAVIRNGRVLTIVKRDEAKTLDIPVKKGSNPDEIAKTDEMVTQIIPVKYTDAVQLVENLKALLPSYATISANQSSNAIILTDTQTNVRRMARIITAVDTAISEVSTVKVFPLKYADAKEVADLINKLFENRDTGGSSSNSSRQQRFQNFISRMRGGN